MCFSGKGVMGFLLLGMWSKDIGRLGSFLLLDLLRKGITIIVSQNMFFYGFSVIYLGLVCIIYLLIVCIILILIVLFFINIDKYVFGKGSYGFSVTQYGE